MLRNGDTRLNILVIDQLDIDDLYCTLRCGYICSMSHKWHIQPDTEAEHHPGIHVASPRSYLRQVLLVEVMNVCHCVKKALLCFFVFCCCCEGSEFWCPVATQHPPPPLHLQRKDRLPIFLSPVPGPGPWHLLDEHSLVLSLSANVWVYWCAVTGPGWSYPTRIRASCCASSVSVCALIATNRQ